MRWHQTDRSEVHDPAAFLATTTTRLAINVWQSARARHQTVGLRAGAVDAAADPVLDAERRGALAHTIGLQNARLSRPSAPPTSSGWRSTTRTGGSPRSRG